jgi:DNA-binding response OmpR family regulator
MMKKIKLLIVDDEADLLAELQPLFQRSGYEVVVASSGSQALVLVKEWLPDLLILDILMPDVDGREVLRMLRSSDNWTPVILLTQVGTPSERALSLQEGADDYLNKPFDPMELIARVQAVLRRTRHVPLSLSGYGRLVAGDIVLDRHTRQVKNAGELLALSARAINLLEYLMLNASEVVSREKLLDQVWGWVYAVETRAVDIRIAELRKMLNDDPLQPYYIETVIGYGYRFLAKVEGR